MSNQRLVHSVCLGAAVMMASCKESGPPECINPADPVCVTVASVVVEPLSAPIDTIIQVGSTAQMKYTATDNTGGNVTALPASWISTTTATATVGAGTGLMTAVAPGTTAIRATVDGVPGEQTMLVMNAPLPLITAVVTDTVADLLRAALSTTPRGQVAAGITTCNTSMAAGNLVPLKACLVGLTSVGSGGNANDSTYLGLLDLFFNFSQHQLAF